MSKYQFNILKHPDFWKFEWKEYLMDIPFVLFSIYFALTKTHAAALDSIITPMHFSIVFCFVVLAIAWYAGAIYARYEAAYPKVISVFVRIAMFLFGFMFLFVYWITISNTWTEGEGTIPQKFLAYFSIAYLVLIPAFYRSGLMTGRKRTSGTDVGILKFSVKLFAWMIAYVGFLLILLLKWEEGASEQRQIAVVVAAILLPIFGGILFYKISKWIWRFLNKEFLGKSFFFFREIIVPVVIGISLSIYFQLGIESIHRYNQYWGKAAILLEIKMLCASGVLPLKGLFMFNPPLRFFNLLFALLALIVLLFTL